MADQQRKRKAANDQSSDKAMDSSHSSVTTEDEPVDNAGSTKCVTQDVCSSAVQYSSYLKSSSYWQCPHPVTVTVKDLVYAVSSKSSCFSRDEGRKLLLDRVSMIARPGEVLAIIGPSGGGKTTLLNVLAMRSPAVNIPSGDLNYIDQFPCSQPIKSRLRYVMAHDKLLPYLTVYETLQAAADLKLPHLDAEERRVRVESVISNMCLDKCRNTYIGGEWRKGLSSGEMKRVAIGIELLDEPSVLILDEPTSGLDTNLSIKVIELLLKEARKGRTIITTVHQPSSQLFERFDRFLLICRGRVAFHGTRDKALSYFSRLGYPSRKDWNASDFLLDLVSDGPTIGSDDIAGISTKTGTEDDISAISIMTGTEDDISARSSSSGISTKAVTEDDIAGISTKTVTEDDVEATANDMAFALMSDHVTTSVPSLNRHQCCTMSKQISDMNSIDYSNDQIISARQRHLTLLDNWDNCDEHNELIREIDEVSQQKDLGKAKSKEKVKSLHPFTRWRYEVITLWKRQSRNSIRNPITAIITLLIQAMQGLIIGGIFFHLPTVGPGPKPQPLLKSDFWSDPWIDAYTYGVVDDGNRPLTDMFTKGVDGKGSYVLGNQTTMDDIGWKNDVHWLMDDVVTTMYNKPELGMRTNAFAYPELVDMKLPPAKSWDEWTPRRVYSNLMAAYQIFDREWPSDNKKERKLDWSFFNRCYVKFPTQAVALSFYTCVMQESKPVVDPLVTSLGLLPLPGKEDETNRRKLYDTVKKEEVVHTIENQEEPNKRRLMTLGGAGEGDFNAVIGDDLLQIVNACRDWIRRVTSCQGPLCDKFKSVHNLFSDWSSSTIDTISSVLNLSGCLFFVTSILGFASYDALLTFPQERSLFNRESANGLYYPSSYYVAKNLADLSFQLIPCSLMSTIFYFMVGFDTTASQYFIYFLICSLTSFCAYGFGYMVSAGSPRMEVAIVIAPLTLVVWLVLAGFFLRDADVPAWIGWCRYLSFYRWSYFALVTNQFPPGYYFGTLPNTVHLALAGVTMSNLSLSIFLLFLLGFVYRLFGFILLAKTNRRVGLEA